LVRYAADGSGPRPQYRFRRVSVTLTDLAPSSDTLYHNPETNFRKGPVVTRLIDGGPRRVTLTTDRLRIAGPDRSDDHAVEPFSDEWFGHLEHWFAIGAENLPPGAQHT
jgi:arylamine N-acetyltransferase